MKIVGYINSIINNNSDDIYDNAKRVFKDIVEHNSKTFKNAIEQKNFDIISDLLLKGAQKQGGDFENLNTFLIYTLASVNPPAATEYTDFLETKGEYILLYGVKVTDIEVDYKLGNNDYFNAYRCDIGTISYYMYDNMKDNSVEIAVFPSIENCNVDKLILYTPKDISINESKIRNDVKTRAPQLYNLHIKELEIRKY